MKMTKKILALFLAVLMAMSMLSVSMTAFAATKKVTKVTLDKTSASVVATQTITLKATVTPSNASNKKINWSTSDKKIATVDSNGKVKGVKAGTVTITAKAADGSGKKATCKVTVKKLVKITAMKMSAKSVTAGSSVTLKVTVTPSNASIKSFSWKSSDKSIATVDSNGKVKGVKPGEVKITATAKDGSGTKATCKVTVKPVLVTGIKFSSSSVKVEKEATVTLKATVSPSNASNKSLSWSSSDKSIATVSSSGKVTGVKTGKVTITAKAKDGSGKKATCTVEVVPITVKKIALDKTSVSLYPGKTYTLKATVTPTNAANKAITWTSSNSAVATVDSNGKIRAIKAGTATITATAKDGSGKKATCKVTVKKYVEEILVSSDVDRYSSYYVGKTGKLTAIVAPDDASDKSVTWESSNTNYVTVDANGNFTVKKYTSSGWGLINPNKVTLTAKAKDGSKVSGKIEIEITPWKDVTSVEFEKTSIPTEMFVGQKYSFAAKALPEDASERGIVYESSDPSIATVNQDGTVTVLKADKSFRITAKSASNGKIAIYSETVKTKDLNVCLTKEQSDNGVYYIGQDSVTYRIETDPSTAINSFDYTDIKFVCDNENVAVFKRYYKNQAMLNFVGAGQTTVYAKVGDKVSEKHKVEVREIRTDKDFFENVKKGDTFEIEAYTYNGTKMDISDFPVYYDLNYGDAGEYFEVDQDSETGKFTVTVINDIPDGGAYLTFSNGQAGKRLLTKKVNFIKGTAKVASGDKAQLFKAFQAYSNTAAESKKSYCSKAVTYSDIKVDNKNSTSELNFYLGILKVPLSRFMSAEDQNEIFSELSPEALINDLFPENETAEDNLVAVYEGATSPIGDVSLSDISSVAVTNDKNKSTYQMKLTLTDQKSYIPLDSVESSAYGKTMRVIDRKFMDDYEKEILNGLDLGNGALGNDGEMNMTFDYGTINQKYSAGYVIYTIDKLTDKVIDSEYHYKSAMKVDKANLSLKATIEGFTIEIKMAAYFTMNVETTTKYTGITY